MNESQHLDLMSTAAVPPRSTETVSAVELDWVNYLNIALMIVSALVAIYLPIELFLFSYAILGPLHYLTEISWLHDRRYFVAGKLEWRLLLLPVLPGIFGLIYRSPVAADLYLVTMLVALALSAGMVFGATDRMKFFLFSGVIVGLFALVIGARWGVLFTVILPTLAHVYAFTGLFILLGAIKGRSFSAVLSLLVYLVCPFVLLRTGLTPPDYIPQYESVASLRHFTKLRDLFLGGVGLEVNREGILAFLRILAFAYTYHYLNWFSKTRIISWHRVTRGRLYGIAAVYLLAVGVYWYDFETGLIALFALSLAHVLLELPLNFRSIAMIASGTRELLPRPRT